MAVHTHPHTIRLKLGLLVLLTAGLVITAFSRHNRPAPAPPAAHTQATGMVGGPQPEQGPDQPVANALRR